MSIETVKHALEDVAFTTPTPFTEDGSAIQVEKIEPIISHVEEAGGELFLPCGNTGEYYALSPTERIDVIQETVAATSSDSVVIGGAGGSVAEILELTAAYEEAGADGIMIMNPRHTYLHEEGLTQYYKQIVSETDLPVVLYKRGIEVPIPTIDAVSTAENVIGVKFAVNDINAFSQAQEEVTGDVVWTNGIAERFALPFAIEGATGFTTGIGSFVPQASLLLMDALRSESWNRAKQIRDVMRPYEQLRAETGSNNHFEAANNVPAVKYGMEMAGLYGGPVRAPLAELSEEDKRRAKQYYEIINGEIASITA